MHFIFKQSKSKLNTVGRRMVLVLLLAVTMFGGTLALAGSKASAVPAGYYGYGGIRTAVSGYNKTLDMPGATLTAGTQFEQFTWLAAHPNQQFAFYGTESYAQIRVVHSNLCLDVSGASTANGAAIIQWTCNATLNQRFALVPAGGSSYYIKPLHATNKCLDVTGASTANGAKIQQWDCNNQVQQRFTPYDAY